MNHGNKGLSIAAMALACTRLALIYASPALYAESPRNMAGPQVEFTGIFYSLLPVLCTMLLAIGLWNWRSWRALLVIGSSVGVVLSALFIHASLLVIIVPLFAIDMMAGSLKGLVPLKLKVPERLQRAARPSRRKSIVIDTILFGIVVVPLAFAANVEASPVPAVSCWSCITESYPLANFTQRQQIFRSDTIHGKNVGVQIVRSYDNLSLDETGFDGQLEQIRALEDTMDFDLNKFLRLLYVDQESHLLSANAKQVLKAAVIGCKYWYTEPGEDTAIFWTENHQILYHAAELLAGQLYPDDVFPISGMTGQQHVDHALPLIERWIGWRGRFGFTEWHSNVYLSLDVGALVNLVDFANDTTIQTKAAMVLDLIGFDMACNYYKGIYATAKGRTYDDNVRGYSMFYPAEEDTAELAWI
ncbi:MAG: hypothetical protein GYA24_19825, partial [Candidatus Lokiarchaeota archaeon]|nr:hypothetical protein [Candidatus Lokiarchaeota archaeon]